MGFSRQEYWSGLPFPSPGDLPGPGIEQCLLAGRFFTAEPPGKPLVLLPVVLHERTSIYLPTKLMGVGAVSSSFAVVNSLAVDTLPHALW